MVDRRVLQYQFTEKLGSGGMGEVYKARDTRLNRLVAIKVLPDGMSSDPDHRRRFVHEARAVSALNHPNIITIYDIVEDGDAQYMVVEYIPGKSLFEIIPEGGLPAQQVVGYATQIADALRAAHSAGIIHRDIKPDNVMVAQSGAIKLLDFGLAKVDRTSAEHAGNTITMNAPLTVEGAILGTVNYMSPEQAEGKRLDARSDIFSFGAVLYEMLTGHMAFRRDSIVATLSAILRDEVQPVRDFAPGVPPELESLVVRCLRKDPDQRFQSMQDVYAALAEMKRRADSGVAGAMPAAERTWGSKAAFGIAVVCAMAVGGVFWWAAQHRSAPPTAHVETPVAVAVAPPTAPVETPAPVSDARPVETTMTNDTVVQMAEANVMPSVIVNQIRSSKTNFDMSPSAVIALSKAGVVAEVIEAMRGPLQANAAPVHPPTRRPVATVTLEDGLLIRLTLAEDIPNNAAQGDEVRFTVAEPVRSDGAIVFPKGAPAVGLIVDAAKKKVLGIGGKMTFRLERVTAVGGQSVPIRATPQRNRDGLSKRPVDVGANGANKPKELAAAAGASYAGYVDGPKTVSVKK